MFNILQKLLPCFASPQQSDGIVVREGFTTVPTPIKTASAPPFAQNSHPVANSNSNNIAPPKKTISPTQQKRHVEQPQPIPEHVNAIPPNMADDEADYDENWEDWKNTDDAASKAPTISFEEMAMVVPSNKLPEFAEVAPITTLPPITSLAPVSATKKSPSTEKKEEEEKPAEPDVDWFSDMTPTYKPPPRLITSKLPTHTASAPAVVKTATPPTVNRLSLASLEMEQEEVDDEGWIEEPEEETAAPTRMSKLDAKNAKKKEKKAKKSRE
eukprot:TRINITY_DN2416_c0_g1_i1.p1 TRINITY_DN2416_c0_g1~~TRINITY_DN2416_c0_g1_i1.p1  ORF type:complete len:270 (+),score=86.65 TRINITY_DN2416_c0_g1_i1:327-1136(+)